MSRILLAGILGIMFTGPAVAQCVRWVPIYSPSYPIDPATFWGTPAPKPLPPPPFVPKKGAGVREEEPVPAKTEKSKDGKKPKENESKDAPRIPKVKLPLPDDPDDPDKPAKKPAEKKESAKKEPLADSANAVDQFLIPSEDTKVERPAEVKVGFFNHSDRDLELEVNGEPLKLPSEQYVTLRLKRTFTWAEKGKKGTEVAVPPDADGIEIVFRK
jgi:hypothetical protein